MPYWQLSWYDPKPEDDLERARRYLHNFMMLTQLEITSPGSARKLFDEFGIAVLGRYPLRTLIDQTANLQNRACPYGVVVLPRADYNGAFYHTPAMISRLSEVRRGGYNLRIAEAGNTTELAAIFEKFYGYYGPTSFAVLGGHGDPHTLELGRESKPENRLGIAELLGDLPPLKSGYFTPDAKIILRSCYTGLHGGLAHHLTRTLGITTIGPDNLCSAPLITPKVTADGLDFEVTIRKRREY